MDGEHECTRQPVDDEVPCQFLRRQRTTDSEETSSSKGPRSACDMANDWLSAPTLHAHAGSARAGLASSATHRSCGDAVWKRSNDQFRGHSDGGAEEAECEEADDELQRE